MTEGKTKIEKISINNKHIIAETVYNSDLYKSIYVVKNLQNGEISERDGIEINNIIYKPFSSKKGLLNKKVLTLPSGLESYESQEKLVKEIKDFIHSYVDLSESFEVVSAYYALMTWVYDIFDNVGYLRVRGNPGNGKSRFLDVMNAISYKSTFFRVSPTEAVIFRTLDVTKGTMIIDEADYDNTSKTSWIIKLLNNGFAKKSSISRTQTKKDADYDVDFFEVFSPKIIANRDFFKDDALESRCFTEYMGGKNIRDEVLVKLGDEFEERASSLRNKLLKFRLENIDKIKVLDSNEVDLDVSPRSKQISAPLATLMQQDDLIHLKKIILNTENNLNSIRSDYIESNIINYLKSKKKEKKDKITIKEISDFINKNSENWEKISNRKIGAVLSNLNIKKYRGGKGGNFIISITENKDQLNYLLEHYSIK